MQRLDRRDDRGGIIFPHRLIRVYVQLNLVAVGIMQVETLAYRMVAHAVDGYAGLFQVSLGGAQLIQAVAHLDADMIQPATPSGRRPRRITDLDQQQFVMSAAGRQRGRGRR